MKPELSLLWVTKSPLGETCNETNILIRFGQWKLMMTLKLNTSLTRDAVKIENSSKTNYEETCFFRLTLIQMHAWTIGPLGGIEGPMWSSVGYDSPRCVDALVLQACNNDWEAFQ